MLIIIISVLNFLLVDTPPIRIISIITIGIVMTPAIYHWLIADLDSLLLSSMEKISAYINAEVSNATHITFVWSRVLLFDMLSIPRSCKLMVHAQSHSCQHIP